MLKRPSPLWRARIADSSRSRLGLDRRAIIGGAAKVESEEAYASWSRASAIVGTWRQWASAGRRLLSRQRLRRDSPRETSANLSRTGHLRGFADQPVAEIVQCGEPTSRRRREVAPRAVSSTRRSSPSARRERGRIQPEEPIL